MWPGISAFVHRHANGTLDRRPCPQFHPGIYAEQHPELTKPPFVNPFARFIRDGKPEGDWCVPVLTPAGVAPNARQLKVALNLHLYYPELTGEFVRALAVNRTACDLLLSTSNADVPVIEKALGSYRATHVEIRVVPNVGRDIGPLLTAFGQRIMADYRVRCMCTPSAVWSWATRASARTGATSVGSIFLASSIP